MNGQVRSQFKDCHSDLEWLNRSHQRGGKKTGSLPQSERFWGAKVENNEVLTQSQNRSMELT
jgi:hypothetical protein